MAIGFKVGADGKKGKGKKAAKKAVRKPAAKKGGKEKHNPKPKRKKRGEKLPFLTPEYNTNKEGRPTKFTKEIAEDICIKIAATTMGLHRICSEEGMPCVQSVYGWLLKGSLKDAEKEYADFLDRYTRAREMQADLLNDEMVEIADNNRFDRESFVGINHIQRAKLMVEARKITSARLRPKKYGSKIDLTTDGQKVEAVQIFIPDNNRNKPKEDAPK